MESSLTLELWIEHNGDTTYISKTDFDERGNRVLEKTQRLWNKRTFNEMIKEPNKIIYGTGRGFEKAPLQKHKRYV